MSSDLLLSFATALAIGLVVGIERGWRERDAPAGSRTAGVRTFTLTALLGAVLGALSKELSAPLLLGIAFVGFAGVFAWFKSREAEHDQDFSVTGVVAALVVFALGALCVLGDPRAAAAGGVATAGLLASRERLHGWLARLTWVELRSALLLLAMSVIILPMLPDKPVDPFDAVNPREVWLFTVLVAAISYSGYLAVKVLGTSKGILISGIAGALVSSTAVTVAFARRATAGESAPLLAGGAALAGLVSILRVMTIATIVAPQLVPYVAPSALTAAGTFGLIGALMIRRAGISEGISSPPLGNPFDLQPLLLFAAGFAVVAAISGWLMQTVGTSAILVTSGVSGLIDVDVAALTAARLVGTGIGAQTAAQAILVALSVNAIVRVLSAVVTGPKSYVLRLALTTAAALSAGALAAFVTALSK